MDEAEEPVTELQMSMHQKAPYPEELARLVNILTYRPGWRFRLYDTNRGQGSEGLTLDIITYGWNSYHRPMQYPSKFEHGPVCVDCGEPFPCSSYRIHEGTEERAPYCVHHYMPVPPAAYDMRSWRRWLFDQIVLVERHEAAEFFTIGTQKPYAPSHGPGNDPYIVREIGTELDVRTKFTGEINNLCKAKSRPMVNAADNRDVAIYRCDRNDKHEDKHHDPERDLLWPTELEV